MKQNKIALTFIIFTCLLLGFFTIQDKINTVQNIKQNTLRFHIVANSDSDFDQSQKLKLRDFILQNTAHWFLHCQTAADAKHTASSHIKNLQQLVNAFFENSDQKAVVTLAKERFPAKVYDSVRLPAGEYTALKITVGSGKGQNWWCVLFPQLCVPAAATGDLCTLYGEDGVQLITEREITFSFKIWEWLGQLTDLFCA